MVVIEVRNSTTTTTTTTTSAGRAVSPPASAAAEAWSVLPFVPPKQMRLPAANVTVTIAAAAAGTAAITLSSNATALYVVLTTAAPGRFEDNSVLLERGYPLTIGFVPWGESDPFDLALLKSTLRVEHLAENL